MQKQSNVIIDVTVGADSFGFEIGPTEYKQFINAVSGRDKIQASHNFCVQTVMPEDKERLLVVLSEAPGAPMEITGQLLEQYAPEIGAAAKKRKTSQKA